MLECGSRTAASLHTRRLGTLNPGYRNEFHAGFQQAVGKRIVVSGEYLWKYTHKRFRLQRARQHSDHLPHRLAQLKDPGYAGNIEIPKYHGFSGYFVASSVAARFFPPQVAGAGATVAPPGCPFRIDTTKSQSNLAHSI